MFGFVRLEGVEKGLPVGPFALVDGNEGGGIQKRLEEMITNKTKEKKERKEKLQISYY